VKRTDVCNAAVPFEVVDGPFVAVPGPQLVAGREDVARVDADADAALVVNEFEDRAELLERATETRALPGSGLEQRHHAMIRNCGMDLVE